MADGNDSEEEPDYMSDEFLAKCLPKDVRPSLLYKQGEKRKHDLLKKRDEANAHNKERCKPQRVLEKEARDAGLQKEIGSDNKGFQLLAKMGYKPGSSIGKNSHNEGQALKEPIPLEVKGDRMGLGKKTLDKEKLTKIREKRVDFEKLVDPNEFRRRKQAAAAMKDVEWDLKKAQSACQTLDQGQEILVTPTEPWYWPNVPRLKKIADDDDEESDSDECGEKPSKTAKIVEDSSEEEDDDPPPQEQLNQIMAYLKTTYFYCIWCGTAYGNEQELLQSCPGNRDDH